MTTTTALEIAGLDAYDAMLITEVAIFGDDMTACLAAALRTGIAPYCAANGVAVDAAFAATVEDTARKIEALDAARLALVADWVLTAQVAG